MLIILDHANHNVQAIIWVTSSFKDAHMSSNFYIGPNMKSRKRIWKLESLTFFRIFQLKCIKSTLHFEQKRLWIVNLNNLCIEIWPNFQKNHLVLLPSDDFQPGYLRFELEIPVVFVKAQTQFHFKQMAIGDSKKGKFGSNWKPFNFIIKDSKRLF